MTASVSSRVSRGQPPPDESPSERAVLVKSKAKAFADDRQRSVDSARTAGRGDAQSAVRSGSSVISSSPGVDPAAAAIVPLTRGPATVKNVVGQLKARQIKQRYMAFAPSITDPMYPLFAKVGESASTLTCVNKSTWT